MKTARAIALLILLSFQAMAQPLPTLIRQGREFLAAHNLTNASARFAAAVSISPQHEEANVMYAITRLAALLSEQPFQMLLDRLGVEGTNRDPYVWTARIPADTNGVPDAPAGMSTGDLIAFLHTNALPRILAARGNLDMVTRTDVSVNLNINEAGFAGANLDYGDILLMRSLLHAAESAIYLANSENLDAELTSIRAFFVSEERNAQQFLAQHPALLSVASTNELPAARTALEKAIDFYFAASAFIRMRNGIQYRLHLFNLAPQDERNEATFRESIAEIRAALTNRVQSAQYPGYALDLRPLFSPAAGFRSFLPEIRNNGFVLGTLPDLTLGNMVSGLTESQMEQAFADVLVPIPVLAAPLVLGDRLLLHARVSPGRGYSLEKTTDFFTWASASSFWPSTNIVAFSDSDETQSSHAFYRVVDRSTNMPPPTNDNFTNATKIAGIGIRVEGSSFGATREPGEPLAEYITNTVWWSWTAPFSGDVWLSTEGSAFPTIIQFFSGTNLAVLSFQNSGSIELQTRVEAGENYKICVGRYVWEQKEAGRIKLFITTPPEEFAATLPNGYFYTNPTSIPIIVEVTNRHVPIEKVEFFATGKRIGEIQQPPYVFAWTNPPPNYYYFFSARVVDASGAKFMNYIGEARVFPNNDYFADRVKLFGNTVMTNGFLRGADSDVFPSLPCCYPLVGGVWWSWTAPTSGTATISAQWPSGGSGTPGPLLGVFTGTSLNGLQLRSANFYAGFERISQVSLPVIENTSYAILVGGGYAANEFILRINTTAAPVVDLEAANDPDLNSITARAFASDPDGNVASVAFYANHRLLGVLTQPPYEMTWSNVPNGNYTITAVATDNQGVSGVSPTNLVSVRFNDNFVDSLPIGGSTNLARGSNVGATKEPEEPNHAGYTGGASVWWKWTALKSGTVTISTVGSDFDTLLAVYEGVWDSCCPNNPAAEDDDSGGNRTSLVRFPATAGQCYYIAVDGYGGSMGSIVLNIQQP